MNTFDEMFLHVIVYPILIVACFVAFCICINKMADKISEIKVKQQISVEKVMNAASLNESVCVCQFK